MAGRGGERKQLGLLPERFFFGDINRIQRAMCMILTKLMVRAYEKNDRSDINKQKGGRPPESGSWLSKQKLINVCEIYLKG